MKIQSLAGAWEFRQAGTEEWLPANVPGGVHTDLLALGLIPDPCAAENEKLVQWEKEYESQRAEWEKPLKPGPRPAKDHAKAAAVFERAKESFRDKDRLRGQAA